MTKMLSTILLIIAGYSALSFANPLDDLSFIEAAAMAYKSGIDLMDTPSDKVWNMPDEDGLYHVGDILYDEARFKQIFGNKTERLMNRNALANPRYRWPNGEVPFIFSDEVSNEAREEIRHYVSKFNKVLNGCVNIKELTDTTGVKDYVQLVGGSGRGCSSVLGKRGGRQKLSLGEGKERCAMTCIHGDVIIHEFLHTLGLDHVQSRPDRDQYIEVIFDNIGLPSQYQKMPYEDALTFGVKYDGRSIMHYNWKKFAIDDLRPTMLSKMKDVPTPQLGSNSWIANSDIEMLYRMYDCDISKMPTVTNPDPCKEDLAGPKLCNYFVENGYCVRNEVNCYKSCNCDLKMCVDKLEDCKELAENTDSCQSKQMQKDCYKSCFPEICSNSFFTTTTTPAPTTTEKQKLPCFDAYSNCKKYLWDCSSNWGKSQCMKTCNHCDECVNIMGTICDDYKKEGRCENDPWGDHMLKYCRKTCKFC